MLSSRQTSTLRLTPFVPSPAAYCVQMDSRALSSRLGLAAFHTSKEAPNKKQGSVEVKEEPEEEDMDEWEECHEDQPRVKVEEEEEVKPDVVDLVGEDAEKKLPLKLGQEHGPEDTRRVARNGQQSVDGGVQPHQEIKVSGMPPGSSHGCLMIWVGLIRKNLPNISALWTTARTGRHWAHGRG